MQAKPSTETEILDIVNSVPKYRVILFLRDHDAPFTRSEIADAIDIHPNNLSGYLRELEAADLVTHERDGNAKLWQLTDEVRADLTSPDREYVPTIDLADVDDTYDYDTDFDLTVNLPKRTPASVPTALREAHPIPAGAVGVVGCGVVLAGVRAFGVAPAVWGAVGRLLVVAGVAAAFTVLAIAISEVYT